MIELIDQSDPTKLKYRCSDCLEVVASSPSRAPDGNVWAPIPENPTMGRWSQHKCDPALMVQPVVRAKPKRAPPEPVVAPVVPPKRGRPRKTPAVE